MKRRLAVAAALLVAFPAFGSELCLVTSSNGLNATVGCDQVTNPNGAIGYSTGSAPCQVGQGISPCLVDLPSTSTFAWTVSSSPTNALDNTGPIGPGVIDLYLWMFCEFGTNGMSAAEFALGGDLNVLSFTPVNGVLNAGTDVELRLAVGGCPQGPFVAGIITVQEQTAVGVEGVETAAWGHVKARYR
jgi:hypothetical protein